MDQVIEEAEFHVISTYGSKLHMKEQANTNLFQRLKVLQLLLKLAYSLLGKALGMAKSFQLFFKISHNTLETVVVINSN